MNWAVGIDLGGTHLRVAHVDENGSIQEDLIVPTDVSYNPSIIISDIITLIKQLQNNANSPPTSIGIGIAGQTDSKNGIVFFAPNLKWHHVPIKQLLEKELNIPTHLTNDVRAATYGEWLYGSGKGCDNLISLFIGTGIGGGIVCNGKIVSGHTNCAGELGHIVICKGGARCTCGQLGCMEAYAGGWAIAKQAIEAFKINANGSKQILNMVNGEFEAVTAKVIIQAFLVGNPLAKYIIDEAKHALIAGASSLVNAFNPQRLILGGGIIKGLPQLVASIETGIQQHALEAARFSLEVVPASLGDHAGIIGAAAWALKGK